MENKFQFKIGDVVRHKTGGNDMVIVDIEKQDYILCEWWSPKSDEFYKRWFDMETLNLKG